MANAGGQQSLEEMLRESRERKKAEKLAAEIFGRRSSTPATAKGKPTAGSSLASRVGVNKRPSSLPRTNSAPNRPARAPPTHLGRPAPRHNNSRPKQSFNQPLSYDPVTDDKSNGFSGYDAPAANGGGSGPGVSIRGAAGAGPHTVIASNFAPGTTAADIESVMLDVGGALTDCHLVASNPTVIAEMTFVEKSGAETVINTFNNKKADGRTLHVYWKNSGTGNKGAEAEPPLEIIEDTMEVDENAESREAENRLREERRGRPDRGFPAGPKADRGYEDDYYNGGSRAPRRAEPAYQDGRYGFGGGERYGGSRGRYRDEGRMYSDGMRRGGGGQNWRP